MERTATTTMQAPPRAGAGNDGHATIGSHRASSHGAAAVSHLPGVVDAAAAVGDVQMASESGAAPTSSGGSAPTAAQVATSAVPVAPAKRPPIPPDVIRAMLPVAYLRIHEREAQEELKLRKKHRQGRSRFISQPQPTAEELRAFSVKVIDTHYTMPPPKRQTRLQQRLPTAAEAAALGPDYKEKWRERVFIVDAAMSQGTGGETSSQGAAKGLARESTLIIGEEEEVSRRGGGAAGHPRALTAQSTEPVIEEEEVRPLMRAVGMDYGVGLGLHGLGDAPTAPAMGAPVPSGSTPSIRANFKSESVEHQPTASTSSLAHQASSSSTNSNLPTPKTSFAIPTDDPHAPRPKRKLHSAPSADSLRRRTSRESMKPPSETSDEHTGHHGQQPLKKKARTRRVVEPSDRTLRPRSAPGVLSRPNRRSSSVGAGAGGSGGGAISVQISCGPSPRKSGSGGSLSARVLKVAKKAGAAGTKAKASGGRKARAGRR